MFNKSRIAWTISALFLVAVTSCSKDEPAVQSPSAGQIFFTAEQAGLTVKSALIPNNSDFVAVAGSTLKTTLLGNVTSWIGGTDVTGIYSPEAQDASGSGGNQIINNPYTANTSGPSSWFTAITKTMYWGALSTTHNFYAYYPFTAGSTVAGAVPIALGSTQVQSAANDLTHIGALDFLIATPIAVISPANLDPTISGSNPNEVRLLYNHVFSIVEFNITGSGAPLKDIKLSGTDLALGGGLIDIKQTTPDAGFAYTLADGGSKSGVVIVQLTNAASLSNIPIKVYMVILPGYAGTCAIEFSVDGTTYKNPVTPAKVAPGGGFLRGQYYTVNVDAGTL